MTRRRVLDLLSDYPTIRPQRYTIVECAGLIGLDLHPLVAVGVPKHLHQQVKSYQILIIVA